MIFFTEQIGNVTSDKGMKISPIAAVHQDGRSGYMLGDDWSDLLDNLEVSYEIIDKSDLDITESII